MTRHLLFLAILLAWCLPAAADESNLVGTVVDETGRPVAGASVLATILGKSIEVSADGAGMFQVPVADEVLVWGSLQARSADGQLGVIAVRQQQGRRVAVKVVLKPARGIALVVVDRAGKPVAEAEVDFVNGALPCVHGRTDAEGRWAGRVPADTADWAIMARKGGVGFDYASGERARGSKEKPLPIPSELRLTLDGVSPIRVMVVNRDGKPLAGANVVPWLIQKPGHEADMNLGGMMGRMPVTGPDGVVTIGWMPDQPGQQRRSSGDFWPVTSSPPATPKRCSPRPWPRRRPRIYDRSTIIRASMVPADLAIPVLQGRLVGFVARV